MSKSISETLKTWRNTPDCFLKLCGILLVILLLGFAVFQMLDLEKLAAVALAGFITVSTWLYVQYRASEQVKWEAIRLYYGEGDSDSLVKARKCIGPKENNETTDEPKPGNLQSRNDAVKSRDDAASKLVNFFEKWGRLVEKGYLPLWVFDGPSGDMAANMLQMLEDDITKRRTIPYGNRRFGMSFVWLVGEVCSEKYLQHWDTATFANLKRVITELRIAEEASRKV